MPNAQAVHGVTVETVDRFVVDAGAVYLNYGEVDERPLGATRGGNTFTIEQEVRDMEIDGLPGPMMGARRIINVVPTIEANLLELGTENLKLAIPGSDSEDFTQPPAIAASHDRIFRNRTIQVTDYVTNVALVGQVLGQDARAIFIIKNGLSTENLELGLSDEDEGVQTLTIQGHFNAADLDATGSAEEPWEIRWPKEV